MKAIHLTAYGNPVQNLQMAEVPEPNAPSEGETLVRMEYAPVDYSDLLLANGVYFLNPQLPSVIEPKRCEEWSLWAQDWRVFPAPTNFASWVPRWSFLICTLRRPSANAAARPRPSAIPPARRRRAGGNADEYSTWPPSRSAG